MKLNLGRPGGLGTVGFFRSNTPMCCHFSQSFRFCSGQRSLAAAQLCKQLSYSHLFLFAFLKNSASAATLFQPVSDATQFVSKYFLISHIIFLDSSFVLSFFKRH